MKIAAIYTGYTSSLVESVNNAIHEILPECEIMMIADPSLLSKTINAKKITQEVRKDLFSYFSLAANKEVDAIYNICSSMGELAKEAQPIFEKMGTPLIRIDEKMAEEAVKSAKKIGVIATLNSTLNPTKSLLLDKASSIDKEIELVDVVLEGTFGASKEKLQNTIYEAIKKIENEVEAIVFAQASMAYCELELSKKTKLPLFSSPKYGALELCQKLKETKGDYCEK